MSGRVINVSPSLLAETRKCSLRGHTRHVLGYTSISDAIKAKAGSAYHAGMAVYLNPSLSATASMVERRALALGELHHVYDDAWAACPADKLDAAYTPENLHRLFDRWMELHPPSVLPWQRVVEVETAFISRQWMVKAPALDQHNLAIELVEVPMSAGLVDAGLYDVVRLIVRPDAVVETPEGIICFVDTKTTGWHVTDPGWSRALRMSLQVRLYADAVVQRFGTKAHYKGWINACEIKKLPESDRKCTTHKGMTYAECGSEHTKTVLLDCTTNAETVAKAVLEAKRAATQFVKLVRFHEANKANGDYNLDSIPIEGASTDQCRFCPSGEFCDSGAIMAALPNFMKHDPWVVEIGKRDV